jgi:hypothetical protein
VLSANAKWEFIARYSCNLLKDGGVTKKNFTLQVIREDTIHFGSVIKNGKTMSSCALLPAMKPEELSNSLMIK